MDIAIGQTRKYLYRRAGQEVPVDAKIIGIDGKQITISFASPQDGHPIVRVLRSARERGRLADLPVPKPGAPIRNQNAAKKTGQKRIGLTISLSGERLRRALQQLEKEERPNTTRELRQLGYRALDAYLGEK